MVIHLLARIISIALPGFVPWWGFWADPSDAVGLKPCTLSKQVLQAPHLLLIAG